MMSKYVSLYTFQLKEIMCWLYHYDLADKQYNLYDNTPIPQAVDEVLADFMDVIDNALGVMQTQQYSNFYLLNKGFKWSTEDTVWYAKPYTIQLFNIIFSRFWDSYGIQCEDIDDDTLQLLFARKLNTMLNILNLTYDRYAALLDAYEDKKDKLLNPVESNSEGYNRYNDTPQDGGDFSDDEHTTSIYQNGLKIEQEQMTPIERLRQIEDGYQNVLLDWSNEFRKLFWEEM